MKKTLLLSVALLSLAVSACGSSSDSGKTTIAVIPKGTSHVFWQSIHAGAAKAAQEFGVDIIWRGPLREDDRASQIAEIEGFITRGVSGIVLAPLDEAALVGPVGDAARADIPVVIIDSGLKGGEYVSFVATDNRMGGRMAAEGLAKMLPQGGRIVVLRYAEGSASTEEREAGFLEEISKHTNILVLSSNQYGGADVDLITGADIIEHPTQSETYTLANPDNPNQIVVAYNDSRTAPDNYSGASFSSDGGTTFTRLDPSPFASGPGCSLQKTYQHFIWNFSRGGLRRTGRRRRTGHRRLEIH